MKHTIPTKIVLVIDGGGRGAALVHKYSQSPQVDKILVVPGNVGMKLNTKKPVEIFPHLTTTSTVEILKLCLENKVDLVDVAQDNAIEKGVVDTLNQAGISTIGPTKLAGQIEWDKAWSRNFMKKYALPTPKFEIFHRTQDGIDFVKKSKSTKWAVKAAGLAEGKGVILARNKKEAIVAIQKMDSFKKAGQTYLVEEWLEGEEFSAFALCDGKKFKVIGYAQDHKRVDNFDTGANTGGMGCVSTPQVITESIKEQTEKLFEKTLNGLQKEERPYKGVLYLGGMVVNQTVKIIEFNARWGDPEAQVILPALQNDYYEIAMASFFGNIKNVDLRTDHQTRVAVAGVSRGYPTDYNNAKNKRLFGLGAAQKMKDITIYTAGIREDEKNYYTNGGRLFYIVGVGKDIIEARQKAYAAISIISVESNNLHYRTDIGFRDVERMRLCEE